MVPKDRDPAFGIRGASLGCQSTRFNIFRSLAEPVGWKQAGAKKRDEQERVVKFHMTGGF